MEQHKTTPVTQSEPWIPPLKTRKGEYVYHWNRILEAIAVLTIVVGLVGYGLYAWLASPADIDVSDAQPEAIAAMVDPGPDEGPAPSSSMPAYTPPSLVPAEDATPLAQASQPASRMPEAQSGKQPAVESEVPEQEKALAPVEQETSLVQSPDGAEPSIEARSGNRSTREQEAPLTQSSDRAQPSLDSSRASQPPIEPTSTAQIKAREEMDSELPETIPEPTMELVSAQSDPVAPIEEVSAAGPEEGAGLAGLAPATQRGADGGIHGDQPKEQAQVQESPKSGHRAEPRKPAEPVAEEGAPKSPLRSQDPQIVSPTVKRFLLAKSVSNNKPRGGVDDIRFNADGVATVYSFSEVVDRSGDRLSYVWLRDGKRVATVRVDVGADRWRSYSTKVINRSMKGAWRVELHDRDGSLLASAEFRL